MTRAFLAFALVLACVATAGAHPLGNATVNRQAALRVTPDRVDLRYLVDMAEIPTLVQQQEADSNRDGAVSAAEWAAHAARWAAEVGRDLVLELDGAERPVALRDPRWTLVPGAAGLSTLRLEAFFTAPLDRPIARLLYRDRHRPAQIGWKEIYIEASGGARIDRASVPQADRSRGLTEFPQSPATEFPNELSATAELVFESGSGASARPVHGEPSSNHERRSSRVPHPCTQPLPGATPGRFSNWACITSPPAGITSCFCSACCCCASR